MKTFKKNKGFTLVETLVAIGILVLGTIGAFTAAQSGISSAILSKDQIIAFYLAQEGVEQVRNIRDENGLKSQNWLTGIASSVNDPCYFGNLCQVDALNNTISRCSLAGGACPVIKEDPVSGFYGYNSAWPDTLYKREISLTSINANEASLLVTVSWSKGIVNRVFKVRENILNWQ